MLNETAAAVSLAISLPQRGEFKSRNAQFPDINQVKCFRKNSSQSSCLTPERNGRSTPFTLIIRYSIDDSHSSINQIPAELHSAILADWLKAEEDL